MDIAADREVVLTKTVSDGRTAVVTAGPYGHAYVTLDGEPFTDGFIRQLPEPVRGMTRAIGGARCIGLTVAEAGAIERQMARITAEAEAVRLATPEGQRDELTRALREAAYRMETAGRRASDDDWSDYTPSGKAYAAALAALAAFDAAHPELAARIADAEAARDAGLIRSAMNQ